MRTAEPMTETEQLHHLLENLTTRLARGKEWATPGVQAALQRAVAGLDTGIETASPRLQMLLRALADELAGGVETLTPRVREQLKRVGPKATAEVPVEAGRSAARTLWWLGAMLLAAGAGVGVWRSLQASGEESVPSLTVQETGSKSSDDDPELAAGRI
ncbi:hypothetical protein DXK94_18110 [Arthrobacter sp. RT-1]|jgi:hypothetical protein|uniref:hypothetical protein n=1 Tax=Arthrobacter sp. RT-1 TaxID=2292263 RepID=UPI000E1EB8BC|nr:hypothetical protein [Arthrobacter sp. RT-1]RDV08590.1 hypothetical protein DXK94_18110 [Arthrobacter sp. RT-1]